MIFHPYFEEDSRRTHTYFEYVFRHQDQTNFRVYLELTFNDGSKQEHFKRSFHEAHRLIFNQRDPEKITGAYLGLHPRKKKSFNKKSCAGICVLGVEITLINSRILPLDFSTLVRLHCFQEFPPSAIIHVAPERLILLWCLDDIWLRTADNIDLMDKFFEASKVFQDDFYGYRVKVISDLEYVIPMPGLLNLEDPANPFRVQIYDLYNSQIVQRPAVIYDGDEPLFLQLISYSIKRFLSYVGLTEQSYEEVVLEEINDYWEDQLQKSICDFEDIFPFRDADGHLSITELPAALNK